MTQSGTGLGLPAILAAMPEELAPFLVDTVEPEEQVELGGAKFILTTLPSVGNSVTGVSELDDSRQPVLLVASGIGLVNAAKAATLAVTKFGATALISSGSAGGVGSQVKVGDIVVATETCYSTADATAFGQYELGQVPRLPARFTADPTLVSRALATEPARGDIHSGLILSGDAFIWEKNYADYVSKFPAAQATDMETSAIGQVAYQFGIPWISIRAISDLCGPSAAGDFNTHIDNAANIAAQKVIQVLSSK